MKLRMKILSGFLILAVMLAFAGIFSIYELVSIGSSVQSLLDDNYRSIDAARNMIESLEREDSGLLLLISGKQLEGREMIQKADREFLLALDTAKENLTIPNEMSYVENIDTKYNAYKSLWNGPITGAQDEYNLDWYFKHGHQAFQAAKTASDELMALNDGIMYRTASNLKNRTHRAIMPGIVAIISALVFTLVFNYFINSYFVNPIISLTHKVKNILNTGKPLSIEIETKDELRELASAIRDLSCMVRK